MITTQYAREYDPNNGTGFRAVDYPLGYDLQTDIAERLGERLQEAINDNTGDFYEILDETVDLAMPVYYSDILKAWQEAGCPDPEDNTIYESGSSVIWELISRALHTAMYDFASGVVYNSTDDLQEALDRLNTIYPYKND